MATGVRGGCRRPTAPATSARQSSRPYRRPASLESSPSAAYSSGASSLSADSCPVINATAEAVSRCGNRNTGISWRGKSCGYAWHDLKGNGVFEQAAESRPARAKTIGSPLFRRTTVACDSTKASRHLLISSWLIMRPLPWRPSEIFRTHRGNGGEWPD